MNISIVCILLSVVVLANCQGDESVLLTIQTYISTSGADLRLNCIKESGVPLEMLEKAEETGRFPKDHRSQCFLKCTFLSSNLIDQNGLINMDTLIWLLKATNPVFIDKIEKNCKQPTNDDLCVSAAATADCILKTAHEEHIQA